MGARRRTSCDARLNSTASTTRSTRAAARSTDRRSTSNGSTRSAGNGRARRSSSTSTCRERFDINYIGEDGERHRAVMIHRTLLGSMERFVGGLIEHYAGAFPVWLAPVQVAVIPITDDQVGYCQHVADRC